MLYLIYLLLLIALIAIAWLVLAAVGVILFYIMIAIAIGTVLIGHGRVYFMDSHPGASRGLIYGPILLAMLATVALAVPGLGFLLKDSQAVTQPILAAPWLGKASLGLCGLSAVFFSLGWRRPDSGLRPPFYAGAAFFHPIRTAIRALPTLVEAGRRALPWVFSHWIGILAGLAAAAIGIPVALGLLAISVVAGILTAVAVGAVLAVPTLVAMAGFRMTGRKAGTELTCSECGRSHRMPAPGPWGLLQVRCACGASHDLWQAGAAPGPRLPAQPWHLRERAPGAQPLAAMALWTGLVIGFGPALAQHLVPPPPPPPPAPAPAPAPVAKPGPRKPRTAKPGAAANPAGTPASPATPAAKPAPADDKNPFAVQE